FINSYLCITALYSSSISLLHVLSILSSITFPCLLFPYLALAEPDLLYLFPCLVYLALAEPDYIPLPALAMPICGLGVYIPHLFPTFPSSISYFHLLSLAFYSLTLLLQ